MVTITAVPTCRTMYLLQCTFQISPEKHSIIPEIMKYFPNCSFARPVSRDVTKSQKCNQNKEGAPWNALSPLWNSVTNPPFLDLMLYWSNKCWLMHIPHKFRIILEAHCCHLKVGVMPDLCWMHVLYSDEHSLLNLTSKWQQKHKDLHTLRAIASSTMIISCWDLEARSANTKATCSSIIQPLPPEGKNTSDWKWWYRQYVSQYLQRRLMGHLSH